MEQHVDGTSVRGLLITVFLWMFANITASQFATYCTISTVMAVFQVFNLTDKQMANVGIIIAFLPTLLEVFSALLANEEYDFNEPKTTE